MRKRYLALLIVAVVALLSWQLGVVEKAGRFAVIMKNIASNLAGRHEEEESLRLSEEEIRELDVGKIAKELEEKRYAKVAEKAPDVPTQIPKDETRQEERPRHIKTAAQEIKPMSLDELPAKLKPLKKHLHEPFKMGACRICHVASSNNPVALVKKNIHEICYECHKTKYNKAFDHKPVKNGECTKCHDPHQSDTPRMLKGASVNELCLKCHDRKNAAQGATKFIDMNARFKHKAAEKSCLECHDPHTSNYKPLLKKEVGLEFCLDCHSSLKDHKDMRKWINSVRYKHGAVTESKNKCLECHDVHASNHANLLKKDSVQTCLQCHDRELKSQEDGGMLLNMAQHLKENPNWHKPIREPGGKEGGCGACHDPHGSDNFSILRKSFTKNFYANIENKDFFCFKCHKESKISQRFTSSDEVTKFRDGDVNLHHLHVNDRKGRACRACHDEHASKSPHLIREYTDFNNIKFPLRFVDAPNGGSCAPACHKKFEYDRKMPKNIGEKR